MQISRRGRAGWHIRERARENVRFSKFYLARSLAYSPAAHKEGRKEGEEAAGVCGGGATRGRSPGRKRPYCHPRLIARAESEREQEREHERSNHPPRRRRGKIRDEKRRAQAGDCCLLRAEVYIGYMPCARLLPLFARSALLESLLRLDFLAAPELANEAFCLDT